MNKIAASLVNFNSCSVAHLHFPAWLVFTVENVHCSLPVMALLVPVKHSFISVGVSFLCVCQGFGMWWISLKTFFPLVEAHKGEPLYSVLLKPN